jgi:hypothetical protein
VVGHCAFWQQREHKIDANLEFEKPAALQRYTTDFDVGPSLARANSLAYLLLSAFGMALAASTRDVSALQAHNLGAFLESGEADKYLTDMLATTRKV